MKKIQVVIVTILIATLACSKTEKTPGVDPTQVPSKAAPTYTPYPTFTQPATRPLEPTLTNTPQPTQTPLPPKSWIWSTTLSDLYEQIYALGYSAEMYHHEDGYWLIHFNDLSSYFETEGWWWYGNAILAWAGEDDRTDSLVDQIGLRKNYLNFPTSDIDERADRFFRRMLDEFGYTDDEIDDIMDIASNGLVDARSEIDEHICYGQLSTGEYIAVRLLAGDGYYIYYIDIGIDPFCESGSSGQDG